MKKQWQSAVKLSRDCGALNSPGNEGADKGTIGETLLVRDLLAGIYECPCINFYYLFLISLFPFYVCLLSCTWALFK